MKKKKWFLVSIFFFIGITIFFGGLIRASQFDNQRDNKTSEINSFGLSNEIYNYIEQFANNTGIKSENIKGVSQLNLNSLPKDVNLKNVKDANLAIYEIDYLHDEINQSKKLYMITYSTDKLQTQADLIISEDKKSLLNFGINRDINDSQFMESATGIVGSLDKGYVMMRKGSITGISTNLEALGGDGSVEIIIYKNGEKINFGNEFVISGKGIKKDYDIQSKGIVEFESGDVISLYVKTLGDSTIKDINSLIEIVTD